MGYDIESVQPAKEASAAFAKKYEYTYLFNKDTGEFEGSDTVYFRSNIWGMSMIRSIIAKICELNGSDMPEEFLMSTSSNDGFNVSPAGIRDYLSNVAMYTGLYPELYENSTDLYNDIREGIKPVVEMYVTEDRKIREEQYGDDVANKITLEDEVNGNLNLVVEFIEYSDICLSLDGYRVF